ncbi:MAG: isopentenyl phosphate kinase [Candidatus Micrarchaeia archaeon]
MELILIKLGGSIITEPEVVEKAKEEEIDRLLKEVKKGAEKARVKVIIGHGGGSFPHVPAKKYRVNEGIINDESIYGTSLTQDAAARLHRIIIKFAIKNSLNPFSIPPSAIAITNNKRIRKIFVESVLKALELGFTPFVYGDVGLDTKQGVSIISTEEILRAIAENKEVNKKFKVKKIIFATDVDGVFDSDPKTNKNVKLIKELDQEKFKKISRSVTKGKRTFNVTGGMKEKIEKILEISRNTGAIGQIVNGKKKNFLFKAIAGEKVTSTIVFWDKKEIKR